MDGRDILREYEKGKQEPVLILTARDALAARQAAARGADDYLCKPFALIEVAPPKVRRRWYAAPAVRPVANCAIGRDAQSVQSRRDACRRTAGP